MKLAITGANGYIGRHACQAAEAVGHTVKKITRDMLDVLDADQETINAVFGDQDACLHLAWNAGFSHQDSYHLENAFRHYGFVEKLILAGVKNIAVAGTAHEIGYYVGEVDTDTPCNPLNPYGIAKNFLRQSLLALAAKHPDVSFKWLRMYYITGDDENNNSIFNKILGAETEGKPTFPLNSGEMLYDFIPVDELGRQLVAATVQKEYDGIINCSTGKPASLRSMVEKFIADRSLKIRPEYNVFPRRDYDSYAIWGNADTIKKITAK